MRCGDPSGWCTRVYLGILCICCTEISYVYHQGDLHIGDGRWEMGDGM